jgi:acyl carrier protein
MRRTAGASSAHAGIGMNRNDLAAAARPSTGAAADTLLGIIAGMLAELRPGAAARPVQLDDRIERDLALDSLSRVELAARIERAFDVRLPDDAALAAQTPRELLEAIVRARPGRRTPSPAFAPLPPAPPVAGAPDDAATILDAFRWHLARHPEREHIRLIDGDDTLETLSYAQLWAAASEVARGMRERGIGRDDAVALMLPTGSAFFHAFLGAMIAGAVPVPMYPPLRWSAIEEHVRGRAAILDNSLARMLVTVPEAMFVGRIARAIVPALREVVTVDDLRAGDIGADAAPRAGSDVALLQYTSGSTADPKGVVLTHDNMLANIRAMGSAAGVSSSDRFMSWLPLYHDMGLIGAWLATLYFAIPLALMPPASFLARPARWLRAIHRCGATISAGPNFAYEIAASKVDDADLEGVDLRAWRLAFNGAEPVREATLERFAARYARYGFDRRALTPVYGLAESTLGIAFPPLDRGPLVDRIDARALARDGTARPPGDGTGAVLDVVSCGAPLAGHEIRIVDGAGREVAERVEGRVEFRGPSATAGYFRNPAATARLFHGDWLDTGDVGYIAGGELFLTSRAKDLIKRGGHNIHPYDLEAAVGDIPGVRKGCVAVFGATDRAGGTERVIVVAETNATDAAARDALRERIVALGAVHLNGPPDEMLLVPPRTVPKTSSGKIRRAACRELYEQGLLTAPRRAVWMQLARLVVQAATAAARRMARALAHAIYGCYAWIVAAVITIGGLPLLALARDPRTRLRVARVAARALLRGCGIPLVVDGLEHLPAGKPAVVVANHASYVDAVVLVAALPTDVRFAAKRELARVPIVGTVLRALGTHFVERVDPFAGAEDTRELAAAVARGETLVLFPEGTFSRVPGLRAFRLGAFAAGAAAQVAVVPVVLRGTRSVLRESRWLPVRGPVSVRVQPALMPAGRDWSAAVLLRDRVRAAMLRECGEPDLAR